MAPREATPVARNDRAPLRSECGMPSRPAMYSWKVMEPAPTFRACTVCPRTINSRGTGQCIRAWDGIHTNHFAPPLQLRVLQDVEGLLDDANNILVAANSEPAVRGCDGWLSGHKRWDDQ